MIKKLLNLTLAITSVFAMAVSVVGVSASAAPKVTPSSAMDSGSNPIFGINMTSCLEVFDWNQYAQDRRNGISNSAPYEKKGCVREENLASNGTRTVTRNGNEVTEVRYNVGQTRINKNRYNQFTVGQASTKAEFGNLPVLGIFPNGNNVPAQALNTFEPTGQRKDNVQTFDRTQLNQLNSVFNNQRLNALYANGSPRTGMPRIPFTGREIFQNNTWLGGTCKNENGKIAIRNRIGPDARGRTYTVADFGRDPNSPITTCAAPNEEPFLSSLPPVHDPEGVVKDPNLEVYQFVFKIQYPRNQSECNNIFPNTFTNYNQCLDYFRTRFSQLLTGTKTGDAIYFTYTFYGAWDDKYQNWIGWDNPDINKARSNFTSNASLNDLRNNYGDSLAILRQIYNQPNGDFGELATRMDNASAQVQNQYRDLLKNEFEGQIRSYDGYSIYAF